MRHFTPKAAGRLLRRVFPPSLAAGLVFCLLLGAMELFGGFFEKLTLLSAAAAMPQGSIPVAVSAMRNRQKNKASVTSRKEPVSSVKTEKESAASSSSEESRAVAAPTTAAVPENAGKISEYPFKPSPSSPRIISYGGAFFSNTSKASNAEILSVLKQSPALSLQRGRPQVLIYHTHSSESYEMQDLGYYVKGSAARTTDERYNMIRVGDEITAQLEAAGIGVIHDRSLYDYPSYSGAYYRSADTARAYLKKYPSIQVTLDIHRDAIEQSDGVRVKPTAVINGKKAAQVMIIAGVDDGTMNFKNWRENMRFAGALQRQMETSYPGLTRAAMVCHRRYNMYLTGNSLLIEVGGHANTLSEAIYSGEMIGRSLSELLKEYQK